MVSWGRDSCRGRGVCIWGAGLKRVLEDLESNAYSSVRAELITWGGTKPCWTVRDRTGHRPERSKNRPRPGLAGMGLRLERPAWPAGTWNGPGTLGSGLAVPWKGDHRLPHAAVGPFLGLQPAEDPPHPHRMHPTRSQRVGGADTKWRVHVMGHCSVLERGEVLSGPCNSVGGATSQTAEGEEPSTESA